jgi:branched-chain amino acid transport system substrate-binding protein
MTIPLFQSHGFGNIKYAKAAGDAADGVLFPAGRLLVVDSLPDSDPQKTLLAQYKKDYEKKFKADASTFGGHAYDAIQLVIAALRAVGPDRAKIRDHIENTKNFIGTGGVFNFSPEDHTGLTKDAFAMITVKGGKFLPAQ